MIDYRTPELADAAQLAELGQTCFTEAFEHLYAPSDLAAFLRDYRSEARVAASLANPRHLWRIAERVGVPVGYCALGLDITLDHDPGARRAMELKQLYLRGSETGSGIGAALMDWMLNEARAHVIDEIVLSVWVGNHAAQRFYARHGFEKWGDTTFRVGKQIDEEYLFGLRL